YSNYGPAVSLAAPGNSITSTIRSDIGQPNPYGTSNSEGGTSYATPLVTGMFALMMSRNSRLSYQDYIGIAKAAATPQSGGPPNWAGAGVINIGAAVARVPMTVNGAALHDWITDAPVGTEVRAEVDGITCGLTTTFAVGTVTRYALRIKSAAEQVGCGTPGSTVDIYIGGIAAQPELSWQGINNDLGMPNQDFTTVSPPPGSIVVQPLNGSWSNIAFLDTPGPGQTALASLPTPWSAAYHWNPLKPDLNGALGAFERFVRGAPGYVDDWNPVQTYDAYWVDAPAVNVASVNPNPAPGRVLNLQKGWNNFTYTGTSKSISDALSQIAGKYTQVMQYDNPTQTWLSYLPGQSRRLQGFGGLFTLKVYWVYMTAPASVTMG
ncbi:MAG: S8 family serine peptidase, partial [Tepidiformaceae bacterium]